MYVTSLRQEDRIGPSSTRYRRIPLIIRLITYILHMSMVTPGGGSGIYREILKRKASSLIGADKRGCASYCSLAVRAQLFTKLGYGALSAFALPKVSVHMSPVHLIMIYLCEKCYRCFEGTAKVKEIRPGETRYVHHASIQSFLDSIHEQCWICSSLWTESREYEQQEILGRQCHREHRHTRSCTQANKNDFEFTFAIGRDLTGHFPHTIRVSGYQIGGDGFMTSLCFDCNRSNFDTTDATRLRLTELLTPTVFLEDQSVMMSGSTGSEKSLGLLREWLDYFINSHSLCSARSDTSWYPTRLLDVGTASPRGKVCLIETRSAHVSGSYIALSYCWGTFDFFKLTSATQSLLSAGCRVKKLSRTFQEAIVVCRSMNIQYLWIDSLCIIQGPEGVDDWLRESGSMGDIYSNAHCVLAATASANGNDGLFRHREPCDLVDLTLVPDQVRIPSGIYKLMKEDYWYKSVARSPLSRRAWVFQERFLARRVVHFTQDEIIWECDETTRSERFPTRIPSCLTEEDDEDVARYRATAILQQRLGTKGIDLYEAWESLQSVYAKTHLSVATDRVIALSGIAKVFAEVLQDTYVVGMWKSRLRINLLWHCAEDPSVRHTSHQLQYRAPSFSWLSLESEHYPGGHDASIDDIECLYEIIDIRLEYTTADTTGPIQNGELLVKGWLVSAQLTAAESRSNKTDWILKTQGDIFPSSQVYVDRGGPNLPVCSQGDEHFCLLAAIESFEDGKDSSRTGHCLILECLNADQGTYRRIGLLSVPEAKVLDIMSNNRNSKQRYPCIEYDKHKNEYMIRII